MDLKDLVLSVCYTRIFLILLKSFSSTFGQCITDPNLVGFYLYPKAKDLNYSEEIRLGDKGSLLTPHLRPRKDLLLIIHGFQNDYTTRYSQTMKNTYLDNGYGKKLNIIVVDWGKLADPCNSTLIDFQKYAGAVKNVPIVGKRIGEFIIFLATNNRTKIKTVHIDGFSLGAHVSGCAGDYVRRNTSKTIGRISGLDPAGPLFGIPVPLQQRLKTSDADFVDVIHTDKGLPPQHLGIIDQIGHVDFYANGGSGTQPGCPKNNTCDDEGNCSHHRSWEYYLYSTFKNNITACHCPNRLSFQMGCKESCPNATIYGENTPHTVRGRYYFDLTLNDSTCTHQNASLFLTPLI